jgi:hypothetical protein
MNEDGPEKTDGFCTERTIHEKAPLAFNCRIQSMMAIAISWSVE